MQAMAAAAAGPRPGRARQGPRAPIKGGSRASRRALDPRRRPALLPRAALLELN
jgi:hypothetical protein